MESTKCREVAHVRRADAQPVDMTEWQAPLVGCLSVSCRTFELAHRVRNKARNSPIISTEKAYHEQQSGAENAMFVFELVTMMVKCGPCRGKRIACRVRYSVDVVPKGVDAVAAMICNLWTCCL